MVLSIPFFIFVLLQFFCVDQGPRDVGLLDVLMFLPFFLLLQIVLFFNLCCFPVIAIVTFVVFLRFSQWLLALDIAFLLVLLISEIIIGVASVIVVFDAVLIRFLYVSLWLLLCFLVLLLLLLLLLFIL